MNRLRNHYAVVVTRASAAPETSSTRLGGLSSIQRALTLFVLSLGCFGQPLDAAASTLPIYDRVRLLDSARTINDAELTNHDGQPFRLSQFRGKVVLVFFGFTNCPDVCPLGMERMRQLEESGRIDPEEIAYVLISVDGERDSPEAMKEFVHSFSPRFIGLTGDPTKVKPIAKNFSASFFPGNSTGSDDDYSVAHSPQIFVVDPIGQLRAEFYSASVDAMSGVVLAILQEGNEESGQD